MLGQKLQEAAQLNVVVDNKPGAGGPTFGAGTPGHFGAYMLGEAAGVAAEPVHYKSTGGTVRGKLNGRVLPGGADQLSAETTI